jgi:hypothetical protein
MISNDTSKREHKDHIPDLIESFRQVSVLDNPKTSKASVSKSSLRYETPPASPRKYRRTRDLPSPIKPASLLLERNQCDIRIQELDQEIQWEKTWQKMVTNKTRKWKSKATAEFIMERNDQNVPQERKQVLFDDMEDLEDNLRTLEVKD